MTPYSNPKIHHSTQNSELRTQNSELRTQNSELNLIYLFSQFKWIGSCFIDMVPIQVNEPVRTDFNTLVIEEGSLQFTSPIFGKRYLTIRTDYPVPREIILFRTRIQDPGNLPCCTGIPCHKSHTAVRHNLSLRYFPDNPDDIFREFFHLLL